MNDIRENKPYSTNQIKTEKPNIPRTESVLSGFIAGSMNASHNRCIHFKQVMAGERIKQYNLQGNFRLLTPKTPTYQRLFITFYSFFVPNSRIWKNAEKFTAQKGGTSEEKIEEIPNYGGKEIPFIFNNEEAIATKQTCLVNSAQWRDTMISSYIPRIGWNYETDYADETVNNILPKGSILPIRGRIAIYNDMERNKEYDQKITEYDDDTVSTQEWLSYMPQTMENVTKLLMRSKLPDSYYSNYRTELQGIETETPETSSDVSLIRFTSWENLTDYARRTVQDSQKNDWEIIAELRGSKVALEGKVQLIGKKTVNLNYAAITQNTYNNNESVSEEFRAMGTQGAYSYTEMNVPLFAGFEAVEEGYIHVIACVQADTVYSSGFDRLELNVNALDRYRPDLVEEKNDVLYEIECSSTTKNKEDVDFSKVYGFKRKFSEIFKLANVIQGDMTNRGYYDWNEYPNNYDPMYGNRILTNSTYTFFETDRQLYIDENSEIILEKKPWLDYTDLLLNKNQAVKNELLELRNLENDELMDIVIKGNNQIFYVGKINALCDLPVSQEIKNDFTDWGEH